MIGEKEISIGSKKINSPIRGYKIYLFLLSLFTILFYNGANCDNLVLERLNNQTTTLPVYKINLNLPVAERYADILKKYKNHIKALSFYSSLSPIGHLMSKISSMLLESLGKQDPEWIDYIKAVSNYAEISFSEAIMISMTYDMACTTAIAQNTKTKQIFLGRNLDFGTYFINSHMNFEAHYYKDGKYLFKAIELAGFRGIINGIKENKYSVSLNLRKKNINYINIYRILRGYPTPNFYLYKVMLQAESFDEASKLYSENTISAPVYYSISGIKKNEGIIISRDYNMVDAIEKLDIDNGKWFIVVCNKDLNEKDSEQDFRRVKAHDRISKIGGELINFSNLFENVMSIYPTNNILTIYTTMQTAQNNGYFNTTVWLP